MIVETALNPFVEGVRDLLYEGETLFHAEELASGGFTADDLLDIRQHLWDALTPEEQVWMTRRLSPPPIVDQIRAAAAEASERRAAFESADAEMLGLCRKAAAQGTSYTAIAAATGTSRQVLTKRLERLACRAA